MIVESFSSLCVELQFERVNSAASHHDQDHDHDQDQDQDHNPQVRISLHPHSSHMEFWPSAQGTTASEAGRVFSDIAGPTVELDATAFVAALHDPCRERDRRGHLHAALMPMIAELEVGPETKCEILDHIIGQTEDSIEVIGGLFEAGGEERFDFEVTAKVLVGTLHTLIESDGDGEGFDGMIPAAEAAVEALERLRIDEVSETQTQCLICLEDFEGQSESESKLCRLGCLHAFHGDCLRAWLKKSHYCPLCRFQLPTQ